MAQRMKREARGCTWWGRILRQHRRSGLSIRAFCRQVGVGEATFYSWRRRLARRDEEARCPSSATFVPVTVTPEDGAPAAGQVEIISPDGWRVCLAAPVDRTALGDVLAALAAAGMVQGREGTPC